MHVPQTLRDAEERGIVVTSDAAGEVSEIAVDLGAGAADAAVDVFDGTVIVVLDDEQFEFDLPPDAAEVTENNGVLTIEGD